MPRVAPVAIPTYDVRNPAPMGDAAGRSGY